MASAREAVIREMKNRTATVCPICGAECRGDGFFIAPLGGEFLTVAVKQCPKCMRLVSMSDDRYIDGRQRTLLAKINGESDGRAT